MKKHTEQFANKYYAEKYGEPTKAAKDAPMGLRRSSRRRTRNQLPAPPSAEGQKVYLAGKYTNYENDVGKFLIEAFIGTYQFKIFIIAILTLSALFSMKVTNV